MVFLVGRMFDRSWWWYERNESVTIGDEKLNRFLDNYDVLLVDISGESIFDYSHRMTKEQIDMIFEKHVKTIYDENGEVIRINTLCNPYMLEKLLERDSLGDYALQKNYHLSLGEKVNGYEKVTLLDYLKDRLTSFKCSLAHPRQIHSRDNIIELIAMLEDHYWKKTSLFNRMLHKLEDELELNLSNKRRRFQ